VAQHLADLRTHSINSLARQAGQGSIIVVFKIIDFFSDLALNLLSGDGALKKKGRHKISAEKRGGTRGRGTASAVIKIRGV
jgi:hypothetical protein